MRTVFQIILLAVLCGLTAPLTLGAQRSGLYKDGQLVHAFDELDRALAAQTGAPPDPSTPLGKSHAVASSAKVHEVSPRTQARNAAFARASKPVAEIRQLLKRIEKESRKESTAEREQIRALLQEFLSAEGEMRAVLAETGKRIKELGLDSTIQQRHQKTLDTFENGLADFKKAISGVLSGKPGALAEAAALIEQLKFRHEPSLAKAGPTIQTRVVPAPRLSRAEADALLAPKLARAAKTPFAAAAAAASAPTTNDLAETADIQITQEIRDKAAALGNNPQAIYEFVRNNVAFQPYLGSRKGSAFTLRQRAGNDTDQASLLMALLRASGVPCRYVRATAEMAPDRAANWLGVDDPQTAGAILTTAGLDGVSIFNGPSVAAIRCTRLWVEAYVPYANYRGVPNDNTGNTWIPLDPAFKQSTITDGIDALPAMGFNTQAYLANYISTFHPLSPIELLEQNVQTWLNTNYPGKTIADVGRSSVLTSQTLGLLPASLPYDVLSTPNRFSELEDNKRFKVQFNLYDDNSGTTFINYTTNLTALADHRVTIEWVGASANDQAVINAHGGIYETPPNLVSVKPLVKIDGFTVAASANSIGMGYEENSDMTFIQPAGDQNAQPTIYNTITAGNSQAIGFDTFLDVNESLLFSGASLAPNSLLIDLLQSTALDYLNRVDRGQERAARLLRMVSIQDVSEAIVESSVSVTLSFGGVPQTFQWTGLTVDADRRIIGPFAVNGDNSKQIPFMLVGGYDGSTMENRIFEDTYAQQAISTIKILELSNDRGIHACYITNSTADCPGLSQPFEVIDAINTALSRGHIVIIPQRSITVSNWSGTGYIDLDPATGAAGYIISGGISDSLSVSGGATVDIWFVFLPCNGTVLADPSDPIKSYYNDGTGPPAYFCGDDWRSITLKGSFRVRCADGTESSQPYSHTIFLPIELIYLIFGPGDYTFSIGSAVLNTFTITPCCAGKRFDPMTQTCCSGVIYPKAGGSPVP